MLFRSGANSSDRVGYSITNAGDFDNDGYDDLLTGGYGVSTVASGAGAAYLMLGGSL